MSLNGFSNDLLTLSGRAERPRRACLTFQVNERTLSFHNNRTI